MARGAMGTPDLDAMVARCGPDDRGVDAERTVLLGHSMGGMVAQELLARSPSAGAQGLVLACTSAAFGRADGDWQARFVAERLAPLDAGLGMAGMARAARAGDGVPGRTARQRADAATR